MTFQTGASDAEKLASMAAFNVARRTVNALISDDTLEEIVARQFVDRLAKQRGITLPKGDIFSEQAAKPGKFRLFQPRYRAEQPDLLGVLQLGLEADHVPQRAQLVVLPQLHDGV